MKLLKKTISLFAIISALSVPIVRADDSTTGWKLPTNPGNLPEDFMGSIGALTTWLLEFTIVVTVLAMIYGGLVYVEASGDQDRITMAKKSIKYAVIGVAMAGLAYAVVNLVITKILVGATV